MFYVVCSDAQQPIRPTTLIAGSSEAMQISINQDSFLMAAKVSSYIFACDMGTA